VYEYGKVEREKKSTIISRDATLGKAAASSSRERGKNTSGDSPSSSAVKKK
jgi:hypothetical protein